MRFSALFALMFLLPLFVYTAELININTADATLLDTLPGIGSSKAQAIIDYRTQNGPFTNIESIQNVSGIGPVTYAGIAPLITVGNSSPPSTPDSTSSTSTPTVATTTPTTSSSGGTPPEYIPIPTLRIVTSGNKTVSAGADTPFTVSVYDGKGNKRDDALVVWSFGDGMKRTGASVFHKYYYPGEYIVVVRASTSDGGDETSESVVVVKDASINIISVSERGITLANGDTRTLDLSLWRLSIGGKEFKIPEDTLLLAGRTTLFPSQVTGLSIDSSASLLYPSGEIAATYPAQPSAQQTSFNEVQKVEPITSIKKNVQVYEKAVIAPSAVFATETAEGAALPENNKRSIFSSPWFLGLIGVVALAGVAFIFI